MKKRIFSVITAALVLASLASCTKTQSSTIEVVSREDGSGTRGAFVELAGVVDADGKDVTYESAEITNSTSVMLTTVAGNEAAIGYVSLGSLSSEVKAVKVDGVEATVDNIKSGKYSLARPFNIAYQEDKLTELAKDFIDYIMSKEGQTIITDNGYISVDENAKSYTGKDKSGKVTLAGSTSVAPVMEKLADEYKKINPDVSVEIQQSGSSAGMTSAMEGVCDIGMASRELKDSEKETLSDMEIAKDGIAVIVNKENTVEDISLENIGKVFKGETTDWSELTK